MVLFLLLLALITLLGAAYLAGFTRMFLIGRFVDVQ